MSQCNALTTYDGGTREAGAAFRAFKMAVWTGSADTPAFIPPSPHITCPTTTRPREEV